MIGRETRLFYAVIGATIILILAIVGVKLRDVLIPPSHGPRIDVQRVLRKIEEAGLKPREAAFYRVVEEKRR